MAVSSFIDMPGGLKMPTIGLGTSKITNETEVENVLNIAVEAGYRHFDTAFGYQNEALIGKALKKLFSSGRIKREDIFITTKLPPPATHPDRVEASLKKSLENLQLDYVDLYLIHFPIGLKPHEGDTRPPPDKLESIDTDHLAIWKKMEEQVDAGRTKSIGVSNFNKRQVERLIKSGRIKPACLQIEVHVYLQQRDLVQYCQQNGIAVVAYAPLGSPGFNNAAFMVGREPKQLPDMLHDPVIKRISEKHKKTTAQIMLRYLLQRHIVPIPKSVTPARIKENISVFDFALDAEDVKALDALEVGEESRVCDFKFFQRFSSHPEWPFSE